MSEDAVDLVRLLAASERLRVVAALALGARSTAAVAERTGLDTREVLQALRRLQSGGLVAASDDGWELREERFSEVARTSAPAAEPVDFGTADRQAEAVLRVFLPEGRLTQIPNSRSKRLVVLDHVARVFEIGVRYPEREVNALLRAFHPDYAALRRYLVDEGFLSREAGVYWRIGGTVEV